MLASCRLIHLSQVSSIVGYLKQANYDNHSNNKKERKVRFRNNVIKSQLRRLRKTKKDLFKSLDGIVQEYSYEKEKFYLLFLKLGVYNSKDSVTNAGYRNCE